MTPFGAMNPFDQIGYLADPTAANASLSDLRCSVVRLGAGGTTGGAATWNQVDTTDPGDPFYPVQQSHDNIDRAVAQGIPTVLVNVSAWRAADLAVPLDTLAAAITSTSALTFQVHASAAFTGLHGYLLQIGSEQMPFDAAPDSTHITVSARGANGTTAATHTLGTAISRQTTTAQYPVDEAGYVAWLTDSVAPLAQRSDIEVIFQIQNEPMGTEFWAGSSDDYAHLVVQTAPVLRQSGRAGQRIAYAGMTVAYLRAVFGAILQRTANQPSLYGDLVDLHLYGLADQTAPAGNLYPYTHVLDQAAAYITQSHLDGTDILPLWITETGTYSGTPHLADGSAYPTQTEEQQAREACKRMLYALGSGATAIAWPYLPDTAVTSAPPDNTYFEYCGLRTRTTFTPKLAESSLREAASFLARVQGVTLTRTAPLASDSPHVVVLTAPDADGRPAAVVWWDFYLDDAPGATSTVTLAVPSDVATVAVRPLVANKANGTLVVDADFDPTFLAAAGGRVTVPVGHNPVTVEAATTVTHGGSFAVRGGTSGAVGRL